MGKEESEICGCCGTLIIFTKVADEKRVKCPKCSAIFKVRVDLDSVKKRFHRYLVLIEEGEKNQEVGNRKPSTYDGASEFDSHLPD